MGHFNTILFHNDIVDNFLLECCQEKHLEASTELEVKSVRLKELERSFEHQQNEYEKYKETVSYQGGYHPIQNERKRRAVTRLFY